ncbi:WD repeat-containing protein 8 [Hygrophoropsis aurantiaca]|uniref:WD repeat-containing protein 8 n=1 Tax=Hygrophoropsis aurantiaca TaxID=72124 RepID=A0ACB8AH90_9AGAM|nr:WD repeat-containing protein 8 [Hygrophoropsis aurantiaca]
MDFTETYKQASNLVSFSQGAHFILNAINDRLIVRRADTLQITRTWQIGAPSNTVTILSTSSARAAATSSATGSSISDGISHIGWSCDSEYILAASVKKGFAEVFKLRDENWSARIEAGAEGLVKAEWAPDGRNILCFSSWGLRVTIWSIVTGAATYIQYPIHPDRGYAFRPDARYFILAERHKSKDTLGVYDAANSYKLVRHFPLPTGNLSSLALSPTGNHVAVWEGVLEYKIHILSLAGDIQGSFSPDTDPGFGIRNAAWHPNGMFIAVAGWDDKVHILDSLTWSAAATLELSNRIPNGVPLWREPASWIESTQGRGFLSYERIQGPQTISLLRADPGKPNPKSGAVQLSWNQTGTYLLVRFENIPTMVHIYDFPSAAEPFVPRLRCVLQHARPVLHARWNPVRKGSLALCCGSSSIYTWSDEWVGEGGVEEDMAECIGVPAKKFSTRDLKWAPDGKGLVLLDKDAFCCAFEVEDVGDGDT